MDTKLREERAWLVIGSLMVLAAVALAVAVVYTKPVMVPFVLAVFLVTIVSPGVDFLVVRWRFPRSLAITAALLLVLAVMTIFGVLIYTGFLEIGAKATQYTDYFVTLADDSLGRVQDSADISPAVKEAVANIRTKLIDELQAKLPALLSGTVGTALNLVSTGFLAIIFVVFLLAGRQSPPTTAGIYAEIETAIRRYVTTKFLISAATGILVGLILWAFGLPMASLFGLLAFLLNFIPSIGSIIATLLPIPVAVAEFDNPWTILAVVILPGSIHMFIGNVLEPKLMGEGLELHPVTVLLSLAAWGLLWGPIGMLLAVPITAMIRIVLMRFGTTRPMGELLAGKLPGQNQPNAAGRT